jgi:hypothetical protein
MMQNESSNNKSVRYNVPTPIETCGAWPYLKMVEARTRYASAMSTGRLTMHNASPEPTNPASIRDGGISTQAIPKKPATQQQTARLNGKLRESKFSCNNESDIEHSPAEQWTKFHY